MLMSHTCRLLTALLCLVFLAGCGEKHEAPRVRSTTPPSAQPATASTATSTSNKSRPAQEIAFIRECLIVGLRPTLLLELESKAIAAAHGGTKAKSPTKSQLKDLRENFALSASKLSDLASSPTAGRRPQLAQLLSEARAKQAANCSRLPDDLLHGEGIGLMMVEFMKISSEAPNQQEADRRAGEHFKQNWPELINLPAQQKAALDDILKTEKEMRGIILSLDKDPEFKPIQREAVSTVIRELETRASRTAGLMTPTKFYMTMIGHQFRPNAGKLEAGEMVKLVINEQKIVGHCIVSSIHLDLKGNRSGQTASLDLAVVHKIYADGHPSLMQVVER
jgi:hypothetical protein